MSPEKQTHVYICTMHLWIPHFVAHASVQWPVLCCPVFLINSTLHCRGKNCLFESENLSFLDKKDDIPGLVSASLSDSKSGTYYPFSVSLLPHVPHHPLQGLADNIMQSKFPETRTADDRIQAPHAPITHSQPLAHVVSQGKVSKIF